MKKQPNGDGQQLAVQQKSSAFLFDVLVPAPFGDEDIDELMCQEPLPPNQSFQLPAEEQPIEED